jgi:hypothetical protein
VRESFIDQVTTRHTTRIPRRAHPKSSKSRHQDPLSTGERSEASVTIRSIRIKSFRLGGQFLPTRPLLARRQLLLRKCLEDAPLQSCYFVLGLPKRLETALQLRPLSLEESVVGPHNVEKLTLVTC